jgi:thiol-disulfide isomerase/thioredoxin
MLEHPKLAEALQDAELWPHFLNFAWWMEPAAVEGMQDALIALGQHIPERTPMLGVLGAADLFDIIASSDPAGYARREPLRLAVIAALERLAKYQDPHDPTLKRWNFARDIPGTISDRIARLSSGATRGTLLDGPAPRIDFIWNSSGAPLSSFEDLQGRIVVADFFTTWCGPCIASFPRVRDLVERYAAAPVADLQAWQNGQTGYPLVDAGMRELWTTGWMHNRGRMVVASFLVKHLLLDWREGEAWFWDTLVDADPASNPASWQWVAGCGADAAPYFRIFNPVLQGEKFDPEGVYVKRWVPELAKLPASVVHSPWDATPAQLKAAGVILGKTYPERVVEHQHARQRALAALSATSNIPAG